VVAFTGVTFAGAAAVPGIRRAGPTGPHDVTPAGPPVSQAYPLSKGRGLEIAKRGTIAEGAASAIPIVLPVSTLSSNSRAQ
jgi:hypothetical protein